MMSTNTVFYEVFARTLSRITGFAISEHEIYCAVRSGRGRGVIRRVIEAFAASRTRRGL